MFVDQFYEGIDRSKMRTVKALFSVATDDPECLLYDPLQGTIEKDVPAGTCCISPGNGEDYLFSKGALYQQVCRKLYSDGFKVGDRSLDGVERISRRNYGHPLFVRFVLEMLSWNNQRRGYNPEDPLYKYMERDQSRTLWFFKDIVPPSPVMTAELHKSGCNSIHWVSPSSFSVVRDNIQILFTDSPEQAWASYQGLLVSELEHAPEFV